MKYSLANKTWDDKEVDAAIAVLKSGNCTMGEITKQCEEKYAKAIGRKYCVMSNSGSSANLLMIAAMMYRNAGKSLKPGDTVIVPAVSWATTYTPLQQYGLKLKFVDIDLRTLNINLEDLEFAMTPDVKAVLAVNLLGVPNNFEFISNLCKEKDVILLLDNCESQGSTYNGNDTSEYCLMTTYSSFFSHHMCTVEGGFTVTDDLELYQLMVSLRAHGWTRGLPDKNFICDKTGNHFEDSFKFVVPGYNLRPNDIFAAIGICQLDKVPSFIEQRIKNHKYFTKKYANEIRGYGIEEATHPPFRIQRSPENCQPSWFGFALILENKLSGRRSEVVKLLTENNIDCRPIVAGNFCKNPIIKYMDHEIFGDLQNSNKIDADGLFIGNSHVDLTEQIDHFFETFKKLL